MLRINTMTILKTRNIIRRHYGIKGAQEISAKEVQAELENMNRRKTAGTLDDFYELLYHKCEQAIENM